MALSSVSVVSNSLLLKRWQPASGRRSPFGSGLAAHEQRDTHRFPP
jgi:hypothetical protein